MPWKPPATAQKIAVFVVWMVCAEVKKLLLTAQLIALVP